MWIIAGIYSCKCVRAFISWLYQQEEMQMAQEQKGAIFGKNIFWACDTQSVPLDPCENVRDEDLEKDEPPLYGFVFYWQLTKTEVLRAGRRGRVDINKKKFKTEEEETRPCLFHDSCWCCCPPSTPPLVGGAPCDCFEGNTLPYFQPSCFW